MKAVTVKTPGKLMLMGEHAVVYGNPCLVTSVDSHLLVTIRQDRKQGIEIIAPDAKDTRFVDEAIGVFQKHTQIPIDGITVMTKSPFSGVYGFGSSAAVTAGIIKALSALYVPEMSIDALFSLAYTTIMNVQKVGSGFDVASSLYGGTILYEKGKGVLQQFPTNPQLVIGYSGIKANTVEIVNHIAQLRSQKPAFIDELFGYIATLVNKGREYLSRGAWQELGIVMTENHNLLKTLGVSTSMLDNLTEAAVGAGALGAKLSGAGGGDCMIALVTDATKLQVADAIGKAGGVVLPVGVGVSGSEIVTSDDQMEQFVVVDEHDAFIGYRSRAECHKDRRLIHRGVDLLVFDSKGRVLLQKRSMTKDTRPGFWASSVGGHVTRGDTYDSAIRRETREELGVEIEPIFHSKFLYRYPNETEYNALYTATYDGEVHIDTSEVETVQYFTKDELECAVREHQLKLTELTRESLERVGFL